MTYKSLDMNGIQLRSKSLLQDGATIARGADETECTEITYFIARGELI